MDRIDLSAPWQLPGPLLVVFREDGCWLDLSIKHVTSAGLPWPNKHISYPLLYRCSLTGPGALQTLTFDVGFSSVGCDYH